MAKEPIILRDGRERLFSVAAALILAGVVVICIVFPKIVSADQPIVPLQATLPMPPKQQGQHDTVQESQLIASLMKNVIVKTDYEKRVESGHWRLLRMRVTAYCPCSQCCGAFADGITANNHHIQPGDTFVAADKSYPFGTKMLIPGYNDDDPVKVADRGGAIKGNRLDLFFHTHQAALQWGVQYLDVLIKTE